MFLSAESMDMWNFNQGNPVIKLSFLRSNFDRFLFEKVKIFVSRQKAVN